MGVFGDLDVNDIPDDPNYVPDGVWYAVVTEAKYVFDKEDETLKKHLIITHAIQDEESDYNNSQVQKWFRYQPNGRLTQKDASYLKKHLIEGLGCTPDDLEALADDENLDDTLTGKGVFLKIKNSSSGDRKFTNIAMAWNPDLYEEIQAGADGDSSLLNK